MASLDTGVLQIKSILSTILRQCIEEKNNSNLTIPIHNVYERVAFYTGISKNYIVGLSEDLQTDMNEPYTLSFYLRLLIMKGLLHFYAEMKLPTVNEVYNLLQKQVKLPHLAQFRKEMTDFGYCYRKTTNGYLLMEDPALTFERFHFLKKIVKFRSNNVIHYLDERVIDQSCSFHKPTRNMNQNSILESLLYCYLVSRNGMVEGMFCNYLSRDEVMNWIKYILLPNLGPSSVIVISNNFLYEENSNDSPSPYASKDTMLNWLRTNNIPCNNDMRKADLYALISKLPPSGECRKVDLLFKAHGHEVLRMPTNLQDLNPTEKAWQDMQMELLDKKPENLFALKEFVHNYIKTVVPLVHKWPVYEKRIIDFEKKIIEIDEEMENLLDSYNFVTDNPLFECQLSGSKNSVIDIELE